MSFAPLQEMIQVASQAATGALAGAIWQGILLAGTAALGLRLLPGTPARVRFAIWFGIFLLLAVLPFAPLGVGAGGSGGATSAAHAWLTLDARWCVWIAALWAAASLVRAVSLAMAAHRVRALWKRARPVAFEAVLENCDNKTFQRVCADEAAGKAQKHIAAAKAGFNPHRLMPGLKSRPIELAYEAFSSLKAAASSRTIEVCVSDEVDRPTVIGFFAPRIVLPEWLLEKLTAAELEQIILHEAGHLSRRDDWMNLLQKLALVVFPLNPALVWIERRLCLERELACDERVLGATGAPLAYAECLARIAEYRLERRGLMQSLALALGAVGRESELARRVVSLLSRRPVMRQTQARFVLGGAMAMQVLAAGAFKRSPQLVAFSDATAHAAEARVAAPAAGFQTVAVRTAAMPAPEWRTTGDAPPQVATKSSVKRAERAEEVPQDRRSSRASTSGAEARSTSSGSFGTAEAVPLTRQVSSEAFEVDQPRSGETVATTREWTPDGDVVVTRWVTVSQAGDSDALEAAHSRRVRTQRIVQRFAAVPVQGGWLVFQL